LPLTAFGFTVPDPRAWQAKQFIPGTCSYVSIVVFDIWLVPTSIPFVTLPLKAPVVK
jgi:hypothetical protein